jgi:hypothetical protein
MPPTPCGKTGLCSRLGPKLKALRAAHSRAGDNKPLYLDHPQFEGFEVRQTVGRGKAAGRRGSLEIFVPGDSSHVAALVTAFDFGGDPAADFVRMRMVPPFG